MWDIPHIDPITYPKPPPNLRELLKRPLSLLLPTYHTTTSYPTTMTYTSTPTTQTAILTRHYGMTDSVCHTGRWLLIYQGMLYASFYVRYVLSVWRCLSSRQSDRYDSCVCHTGCRLSGVTAKVTGEGPTFPVSKEIKNYLLKFWNYTNCRIIRGVYGGIYGYFSWIDVLDHTFTTFRRFRWISQI